MLAWKCYKAYSESADKRYSLCRVNILGGKMKIEKLIGHWDRSDDQYETCVCSVCHYDTGDYKEREECPNCHSKILPKRLIQYCDVTP